MNTPGANAIAVAEHALALDAGHGPPYRPRQRVDACRKVGEEIVARHRTEGQDARHRGPGQNWNGSCAAGASVWDGNCGARSLRLHRGGQRAGHPHGQAGRSLCRRGLPELACRAHAANRGHDQCRFRQENEAGSQAGKLRARRTGRRSGAGAGVEAGTGGGSCARCLHRGASEKFAADGDRERYPHAAHRGLDLRGPGGCRLSDRACR